MFYGTWAASPTSERDIPARLDSAAATSAALAIPLGFDLWADETPDSISEYLAQGQQARLVGFFPGLGSRAAYRDLGRFLLDSGIDEVTSIYHDAARALGFPEAPHRLLAAAEDLPHDRLERQGHIGAVVLTHSLALEAYLRTTARRRGTDLAFRAYTGESFGILTAAVASGSLSVADGVRIAYAFTPLSLIAADGTQGGSPYVQKLAGYLPASLAGRPVVPEPYHVVGLRSRPDQLAAAIEALGSKFPVGDVEVHKRYTATQTNVYVRGTVRNDFDAVLAQVDDVKILDLKEPTTFLAHSARMGVVRSGLDRFMHDNGIVVGTPRIPVIANHRDGVLTTADEMREGILAMTDRVMDSHATAETLDSLHADAAVELGPGGKSVRLLGDGNVSTPAVGYTGTPADTDALLHAINSVGGLKRELELLRPTGDHLDGRHLEMLRGLFRSMAASPFSEAYTGRAVGRIVTRELLRPEQEGSSAYYRLLEAFQHTWTHRARIDLGAGDLVLRARQKKYTDDHRKLGQSFVELRIVGPDGTLRTERHDGAGSPETLVVRLGRWGGAEPDQLVRQMDLAVREPLVRMTREHTRANAPAALAGSRAIDEISYQVALYHLLRLYRPSVTAQRDTYLRADDPVGWLSALAVAGATDPGAVVELCDLQLNGVADVQATEQALDRLADTMRDAETPVISPDGVPLYARRDLIAATRTVLLDQVPATSAPHLAGHAWTVELGPTAATPPAAATPLAAAAPPADDANDRTVTLGSHLDVTTRGINGALDWLEDTSALDLTIEKKAVLRHAQGRRVLTTTVNTYINPDERVVGFGAGGSESMTVFLLKDGSTRTVVRKILSEALVTAAWSIDGTGVMLPPFAKAKQQAEYLRHLPEPVNRYFPEVFDVIEREIPAVHPGTDQPGTHQEVIYEMSFIPGDEVSRYIERYSPPPPVVAKMYEEIYRVIERDIHSVNRIPAPGSTIDESYLTKIEDRLALSRRTAPHTFGAHLLEPEWIRVNGNRYRNVRNLLRWFREHPEHHRFLEPRFHSLVMGDTNTENIKISHTGPLHMAHKLIEQGVPRREIDAALAAITPDTLGIKFLDPRAIGYRSTGRETIDDPMYDNKPWHNSIGHYDEMHFEHFQLDVRTSPDAEPAIRVDFEDGNPFQRAYRVRDVVERGGAVDPDHPKGMEDYFARVMTRALGLDDPDSTYLAQDPYWLVRFVFMMGTHFTAMPPFHFQAELDGTLTDSYQVQRRPVAIYGEGIKWLNWSVEMLEGKRTSFLGLPVPRLH
ncbi:hypothetical protein AB1046_23330 [Promicromonospora sp. Populi]|uniref:hypothetical protein n=1 Tax=Promicromonospora sp. Populi TaxID=3239420 RepID=UPI0034E1EDEA